MTGALREARQPLRRRRLSLITRAPYRKVMGVPVFAGGAEGGESTRKVK
jgi:hypothetical protein